MYNKWLWLEVGYRVAEKQTETKTFKFDGQMDEHLDQYIPTAKWGVLK